MGSSKSLLPLVRIAAFYTFKSATCGVNFHGNRSAGLKSPKDGSPVAHQIDVLSRKLKIFQESTLFRYQRIANPVAGEVIADDFMLNQYRTDDVEVILHILPNDLLNEDEIADSLLLMDEARLFHVCDARPQL